MRKFSELEKKMFMEKLFNNKDSKFRQLIEDPEKREELQKLYEKLHQNEYGSGIDIRRSVTLPSNFIRPKLMIKDDFLDNHLIKYRISLVSG